MISIADAQRFSLPTLTSSQPFLELDRLLAAEQAEVGITAEVLPLQNRPLVGVHRPVGVSLPRLLEVIEIPPLNYLVLVPDFVLGPSFLGLGHIDIDA